MKRILSFLPFVVVLLGVSFLLYPTVSDLINKRVQSVAISEYQSSSRNLEEEKKQKLREEAGYYNQNLSKNPDRFTLSKEEKETYNRLLDVSQTGIIGAVNIPKLHVDLPIYHGVEEGTLQVAAGHLPGSSLPVGGKGTHCVLSGHSGLPSARLFTDLDRMKVKDTFILTVLGEKLAYEVDQIVTVLPNDSQYLRIDPDKDLCTLLTCTPYGVNTHRLLVRGHRIPTPTDAKEGKDKKQLPYLLILWILLLLGLLLLVGTLFTLAGCPHGRSCGKHKKRRKQYMKHRRIHTT